MQGIYGSTFSSYKEHFCDQGNISFKTARIIIKIVFRNNLLSGVSGFWQLCEFYNIKLYWYFLYIIVNMYLKLVNNRSK